eukprot:scaffold39519_cov59-Attheya_sp.AAC.2
MKGDTIRVYAQRATDDARTTPGAKLEENIASNAYDKKKPRGARVPAGDSAENHRILPQKAPLILFGKSGLALRGNRGGHATLCEPTGSWGRGVWCTAQGDSRGWPGGRRPFVLPHGLAGKRGVARCVDSFGVVPIQCRNGRGSGVAGQDDRLSRGGDRRPIAYNRPDARQCS